MNATTWLRVSADMHEPTDSSPPATSRLPTYAARIAPYVGASEVVDGDPQREGERERERGEQPGGEKLAEHRLPQRDRLGQQQLDAAGLALLRPQLHGDRGDQEQVQPGVEIEERREVGLAALVEAAQIEREGVRQHQKDENEHVRERRCKVTRELAAHDDAHVAHGAPLG